MNHNIETLSGQLVAAVSLILNPLTPNNQRYEANKMLDLFRDTSPLCAECGFFLSAKSNSSEIRHFGLQLIEHYIKLHWNEIPCEEKNSIKNKVLGILSNDLSPNDINHIKVALSRIVVEMIVREWPQQWPTLLDELHRLCLMGTSQSIEANTNIFNLLKVQQMDKIVNLFSLHQSLRQFNNIKFNANFKQDVQTEVVLLIFLRLAEDIVQFQNVPDKRRREVFRALGGHLKDLFPFFLKTLSSHYTKYCDHTTVTPSEALYHCRIVHVTLETLCVYLEWITIQYISEDTYLLKQLCHLLDDERLQIMAAKCLLSLVERKGKTEDRIPILKLFEENELFKVRCQGFQSSQKFNEFEKTFCRMLVTLGTTLSYLMGLFKEVELPKSFPLFLNCVLSYTRHPNLVISQYTQNLWMTFLRDKNISQCEFINAIILNLLKYEAEKLFNIGYPSKPNSKASVYSLIEFDSDEDFELTFHKFRAEVMEVIKIISKLHPELAFQCASAALKSLLNGKTCPLLLEMEDANCLDVHSVWDSFVHFVDSVFISLMRNMQNLPNIQKLSAEGVELLQMTIAFNCEDLYIMSYVLSCTSALFFFANFCPDLLTPLLRKIFSNLNQTASDEKNPLLKDVLNLRRHSCSLLIKLATSQTKLLLNAFDVLCQCVRESMERPEQLSALEKSALLETLMILSNELYDYDKQLEFLKEMLTPVLTAWLTDEMKLILSSPDHFITFMGLNESPDEYDSTSKNRAQLLFCVNVIKTCAKRCKIVTNPEIAEKGKFIHPVSQNVNSVLYRNPSAMLLIPTFEGIFYLTRTLNALHDPAIQAKIHPDFIKVTEMGESDRNNILGIPYNTETNSPPRSNFERMKNFLQGIYDNCLHTLGDSTENLSIDFYMMPNLSNYFNECLFNCLQYLPDYKLRTFIPFLKPFFYRCPVDSCGDLVMNILTEFCKFMFQKLSSTWKKFKQNYGTSIGYEEKMTEIEEVLEDQLNRLVSREYITFLGALLQGKPMIDSSDIQMDDDSKPQQTSNSGNSKQLSELGLKIFQTEAVRGAIICSVFDGLYWLDTVTNINCLNVCELVFKQLLKDNLIRQEHEAKYLLQNALHGLQELGEHESNQGLLLSFCMRLYEELRPMFPGLRDFLMSCAGCNLQTIDKMESILFKQKKENIKQSTEKQKKEAFKNAVQNIIGKNIGQYHKRGIVIKDLPPLFIIAKEKKNDLLFDANEEAGLCRLFTGSD